LGLQGDWIIRAEVETAGGSTDTGTGTATDTGTTTDTGTGSNTGTNTGTGTTCTPNATMQCVGTNNCLGTQTCASDGSQWGPCYCGGNTDTNVNTNTGGDTNVTINEDDGCAFSPQKRTPWLALAAIAALAAGVRRRRVRK